MHIKSIFDKNAHLQYVRSMKEANEYVSRDPTYIGMLFYVTLCSSNIPYFF